VHVTTGDIRHVALPVMRHRIIPTFNAEAAGIDTDAVISRVIKDLRFKDD
jgi:MoxR-like ATPase